ncbi:hypothetical protein FOIG_16710 [Fusarium odoratissimum NRRL 54006]|nr:uncharacterized protein FOIG_16710 [Fusarium odoratissimum NRRL 54006]EXL90010.1 hypothetical protein FOIG_16710 [Fusarium odoratissimum NRRL 54006]
MSQSSNEARTLLALQALQNDPKLSTRRAAKIYEISEPRLRRRRNGIQSRRYFIPKSRKLSDLEEQIIVQFILDLDSRGFPSRLRFVEEMANSLLADRDASPVGKRWAHNFVKRQPELKTRLFRKYDYQRAKCEDLSIIRGWFRLIQNTIAKYGIRSDDIWNFDETGFMMGAIMAGMVVTGSERQGRPKSVQPGNREWITVIQAINAEGQSIAPFIIGAGQYHLANWYRECNLPGDWVIATTQNGWTNNELGLDWLKHFDRSTTNRSTGPYRLLILDGHESHHSADFERYCEENKIVTLCMPAHASHLLQTLDVGCFGPLKKAYGREIEYLIRCSITHISKTEFFPAFYAAFKATFTKSNIQGGFKGAGLAPFDPENVISKLDVQLRTPTPPQEAAEPSTPWVSKTPKTAIEAQSQSEYLEKRIKRHKSSSPESIIEALKSNTKATKAVMHEVTLLRAEVRNLRDANEILSRRRRAKRTRLQKGGAMTVEDASQVIDQMDVDTQVVAESCRGGGRARSERPAGRRCGVCGKAGHNARTCQVVIETFREEYIEYGMQHPPLSPPGPQKSLSKISLVLDYTPRQLQTRVSPDDLPFESSSFDAIFRTTHPEKAKLGPSGKRKTSGRVINAIYHAKRKHASILQTEASTVDEHDSDIITRPSKQPRMDSFFPSRPSDTTLRRVLNRQQYIESIVDLLTRRRLPFSAVKWDEMQDIILACNPAIEDLLLTSRDAAMRHITTTFDLYRSQLKAKLQASVSKIHLSTDLWTSPHRHGILAVCVRWVDNGYRLQKALLAMPECRYSHSGERQATLMAEAIEEYGIAKQIGYHTGDNATSNDTCLKHLSQMLQDKYGLVNGVWISFRPNRRRIRCIAHIINLSLQAFLLASSKEALRAALAAASDVTGAEMYEQFYFTLYDVSANEPTSRSEASEQQEQSFSKVWKGKAKRAARKPPDFRDDKFRGWQTIPAMRKLHNIAVWLRNSSIHSDLWEDRVSLRLGIDNDTRWNSWYKLIDNLIRRQSQIKQFLLDYDKEINDNILNSSDWDYLERTHRFLHPFASATLWAEGKNSTLSQILTIMDGLLRHYEKNKEHYSKPETFDRRILHSIEMGWFILDKYYTMTEDAPVYAAALLLDPSKRIRYIERHWPESWHENAIAGVRTIWEEYKTQPETGPAESVDEVSASQKRQPNEWDALLEELEVTEDLGDSMDDLEDFIKATPIKISGSPLQWWCNKDQRKTYPQLSRMAIDILSIAPESADPESAFSGGRRTLSWDRERMTCENLEKVECIGNWLREGHIQKAVHGGMGVITDTGFDSGGGEDSDVNFD